MNRTISEGPIKARRQRSNSRINWTNAGGVKPNVLLNVGLLTLGLVLNIVAYKSALPGLAALLFFGLGMAPLALTKCGGKWERRMFVRVYAIGWVAMGIAGIYAEILNDPFQRYSDAGNFFDLARELTAGQRLEELRTLSEGALSILLWRNVYDVFTYFGFPKERYIGLLVNVVAVAYSAVIGIKMTRHVFGEDDRRFGRLTVIVSSCGLFWLFAGIHLRDATVLLAVSSLAWLWTWTLARPTLGMRFWVLVTGSIVGGALIEMLRDEYAFVPFAMAIAGLAAIIGARRVQRNEVAGLVVALILFSALILVGLANRPAISAILTRGYIGYLAGGMEQHGAGSLGMRLIVTQPLPIRVLLGSAYLYVFPIPFWTGFQLESAYNLFKSCNALLFYLIVPLLAMALYHLWCLPHRRSPGLLFLLFSTVGFTIAVAGTSLETRHFGTFLIIIFVFCLEPDLVNRVIWRQYSRITVLFIMAVASIHGAWVFVKR